MSGGRACVAPTSGAVHASKTYREEQLHMTDAEIAGTIGPLTPRQDRLEAAIIGALRTGGTRSALRVLVEEFADHARVRGTSEDSALATLKMLALRASPELAARADAVVGESIADRITMMARWLRARYVRAD
jgi:hypothetical protein